MNKNIGNIERIARVVIGLGLIIAAILLNYPILYVGIVPLLTGIIGNCPAYSIFKINTCKQKENCN